ncbi:variable surface lipoprotein [Mycoplasmopsis agalactiae]|uniref:variable surface lipoprotein n=1 Tax=Mycoplasmopsis agalactiae TaxID=2110 RepID=UPI001F91251B|nr:variable surface lipoprotein [Mycoplasmopsis agalactiae]MCE6061922.1 variable surface lipoprotein [Mycoplasmopsis agalactiae]
MKKNKLMLLAAPATLFAAPIVAASCTDNTAEMNKKVEKKEEKQMEMTPKKNLMEKTEGKMEGKDKKSLVATPEKKMETSPMTPPMPKTIANQSASNDSIFESWYTGAIVKEFKENKNMKTKMTSSEEVKIFDGLYPSLKIKDEPKVKVIDPWTTWEVI